MTPTPFARTFARLLADRRHVAVCAMTAAALVLGAWCWWAARAQVTVYEVSATARVELDASTSPLQAPLAGRVVSVNLHVGQTVRKGEALVEIDAVPDELELRQETVRAEGLAPEVTRLRSQMAAEERVRAEEQHAARLGADEAAQRIRGAETEAAYADGELDRVEKLHRQGLVPDRDRQKARADAERLRAALTTLEAAARRVPQEQVTRDRERDVRIERLAADIARLEAQATTLGAGLERLGYEIERRHVRAPVDGIVAEAAQLRPGAVLQPGERLASIAPTGRLLIAAQFPADRALGRIRPGQPAALRLDAFPWAEFGSVTATVTRVAGEIRDGHVRVELAIAPQSTFRGNVEHGMPGSVEVAVEQVTPLSLLLRTAGQAATAHQLSPQ